MKIPFNRPYVAGKEIEFISDAISKRKFSGNYHYTQKCHEFFQEQYNFNKVLLTTSCTDALEMASLILNIESGDEVILPSYTFVSTANAFALRGAKLVFVDSEENNPNIDAHKIEEFITNKTKAIVIVHYAGVACDMGKIIELATKYNLFIVEDAAQAIDSYYKDKPLGGIGDLGTFSFHETKNITCGEGGLITLNKKEYEDKAEIFWEKGTNRSAFFRGEVDKYGWVNVGSSFLPSELNAAFLYSQLINLKEIQNKRIGIWNYYNDNLQELKSKANISLPEIPDYATLNGHLFYLVCESLDQRTTLINHLRSNDIHAVFHYQSLHLSQYFKEKHDGRSLPNCDRYTNQLVRLPLYAELSKSEQDRIIDLIYSIF